MARANHDHNQEEVNENNVFLSEWFLSRPKAVQDLIRKYPPREKKYRVTASAPYGFTCPGSVVDIIAYGEDGRVRVELLPEDKMPECRRHEIRMAGLFHKTPEELQYMAGGAIHAYIQPKFLEPIP